METSLNNQSSTVENSLDFHRSYSIITEKIHDAERVAEIFSEIEEELKTILEIEYLLIYQRGRGGKADLLFPINPLFQSVPILAFLSLLFPSFSSLLCTLASLLHGITGM